MNIEPIIFFDLVGTIFILAIALVGIVFYFSHILKKHYSSLNAKDENIKNNADLLDVTRQKAVKIINEANNRAIDIINKASLSTDIASHNFNQQIAHITSLQIKEFEKDSSDFIKLYNKILQDLKSKNIEIFQNISKDIEVDAMGEIKNFKNSLEKLTIASEDLVKKKIDANYEAVKKRIENYKQEKLRKIDDEIYVLLEKISKLVLGKALNLSEHEDLILKSLEKTKKEGVFEEI
ncbi:MAG: hypothetical protein HY424_00045 [Candidatus Levybacteria bacterium]|nr:hypothetical protein [Candidatus Levybacteria bacterium]